MHRIQTLHEITPPHFMAFESLPNITIKTVLHTLTSHKRKLSSFDELLTSDIGAARCNANHAQVSSFST